ncbi:MAG: hypothetical protein VX589_17365 [Myxococcota bacterium]|nr:hypothetical protein [Myxococcota bacterium]
MDAQQSLGIRMTDMIDAGEQPEALSPGELDAFQTACAGRALLQQLDGISAPSGFTRRVQSRVRRRSGGRLFHPVGQPFGQRISVESFVVIAIVVMAACWLMMTESRTTDAQRLYLDSSPPVVVPR